MAVTTLLGLPIPQMSDSVGKTIPDLASAMQMIDEKLGGSRIVDHNLDVASPPNGYYARWENGLQVCFLRTPQISIEPGGQRASDIPELRRAYAAVFLSSPFVALAAQHSSDPFISRIYYDAYNAPDSRTHCAIGVRNAHTQPIPVSFCVIALGRWK